MESLGKGPEQPSNARQLKQARRAARAASREQEAAKQSRRTLLKRLAAAAGVVGVGGTAVAVARSIEPRREKSLKEKVLSLTWKDAENPEKLQVFLEASADGYLQATHTPRLTKKDILEKTSFYRTEEAWLKAVREEYPTFHPQQFAGLTTDPWGVTDPKSGKSFMNLQKLRELDLQYNYGVGRTLLDAMWHEWGHKDVIERSTGELIGKEELVYFFSPVSQKHEPYERYRGGEVFTATYFGFKRWNEVLNETINEPPRSKLRGITSPALAGLCE